MPMDISLVTLIAWLFTGILAFAVFQFAIIYKQQKEDIFLYYVLYLSLSLLLFLVRIMYDFYHPNAIFEKAFPNAVEAIVKAQFWAYALFIGHALGLSLMSKAVNMVYKTILWCTPVYVFVLLVFLLIGYQAGWLKFFKLSFTLITFISAMILLVQFFSNIKRPFFRYIIIGAFTSIVITLISFVYKSFAITSFVGLTDLQSTIGVIGTNVIFLTLALGHRLKELYIERQNAMIATATKEQELKHLKREQELEKFKSITEGRQRERSRIAAEMHDDIGPTLSTLSLFSQVIKDRLPEATDVKLNTAAENIYKSAFRLNNELREVIWSLSDSEMGLKNVKQRLEILASDLLTPRNIQWQMVSNFEDSDEYISGFFKKNLLLIYKECLHNAAKYSNASRVFIECNIREDEITMNIRDDGKGFDIATIRKGLGLQNIQQRTTDTNGELTIESIVEKGTRITCTWKLADTIA